MNLAIKTLEEIGENNSLKDFDNLHEMLSSLELKDSSFDALNLIKKELVCGLVPEDDGETEDEDKPEK